jgi:hypothetical protein
MKQEEIAQSIRRIELHTDSSSVRAKLANLRRRIQEGGNGGRGWNDNPHR